jgi:hypothetical protein
MPSTTYTGEEIGNNAAVLSSGQPVPLKSKNLVGGTLIRMKATDTGLSRIVYWYSIGIDTNGTQYTGAGPLTDITYIK